MNPQQYLQRIQAICTDRTIESLSQLQRLHLQHIPFENLDIIRNIPIYLNSEHAYRKIVEKQRGGYCYELNGLFHWLLRELGFQAHYVAATVMRPTGEFAKSNTHVAIIVNLDQPYLVDVGFGNSNYEPIPLNESEQTDVSGTYKVVQMDHGTYDLVRKESDQWKILYRFTLEKKQLTDFHEGIVFNQVSKQSTFTESDLVTKATAKGRMTLQDHTLITTHHGEKQTRKLDQDEKTTVLQDVFGIRL